MTATLEDENDLQVLRGAWEDTVGTPPDKYLSKRVMMKALAWHRQCEANGGFRHPSSGDCATRMPGEAERSQRLHRSPLAASSRENGTGASTMLRSGTMAFVLMASTTRHSRQSRGG